MKKNRPSAVLANVARAARKAEARQIFDYKTRLFENAEELECPASSNKISFANCHIHHQYPFSFHDILKRYLALTGVKDIENL